MSWIRKSPFQSEAEAIQCMVDMLAAEAESAGYILTAEEKAILSADRPIPTELREKLKDLIQRVLLKETGYGLETGAAFGNSLEWAGESSYPNVARLAEEVVIEGRAAGLLPMPPARHGWGLVRDKAALIGCGLAIVLSILVIGRILFSK